MSVSTSTSTSLHAHNNHNLALSQLEDKVQEAEGQMNCLAAKVGFQAAMAISMLQVEKRQLDSANLSLKDEIPKLKARHINELESLVEKSQAQIDLVVEKVKAIIDKIDVWKKKFPHQYCYSSDDINLLLKLYKEISKFSMAHLKKYPTYSENQKNQIILQEQNAVFPLADALILKEKPQTRELMEMYISTYKDLEKEVLPLRSAKEAIGQKKIMINFHEKHIAKINKEIEPELKQILGTLNFHNNRIKWEQVMTPSWDFFRTVSLTPNKKMRVYNGHVDQLTNETNRLKENMEEIIKNLETYINQQLT